MARIGKMGESIAVRSLGTNTILEERKIRLLIQFSLILAALFCFNLAELSAQQSPVKEMSDTIEALCPKLVALNGLGQLDAAQQDVLARCSEVKIQPGEEFNDLTDTDRAALANMTSTQSSSMSRMTVEFAGPQTATVAGRLQALRIGSAGGLALQMDTDIPEPILYAGPVTSASTGDAASGASNGVWDFGRLGLFINGVLGTGDRDFTANEPGFDIDTYNLTAGVDYRFTENLVLGTALGYAQAEADIDGNAGEVDTDGYGLALYGTYYVGQLYFDVIGVYGTKDYEILRNVNYSISATGGGTTQVNQSFEGDPDADEFGLAGGVGYSFIQGALTIQPYGMLQYLDTDIDGYTESLQGGNADAGFGLALQVDEQNITSLISAVGARVSYSIATPVGVILPQLSFDWQHEYDNDQRTIQARFVNGISDPDNSILIPTDDPDRDYYGLGVGLSAVFPRGISAFAYYDTLLDLDDSTFHQFTLGVRFEL